MKILIANAIYPTDTFPNFLGGAEKSVRKIAEGLADLGHDVHVVVPRGPRELSIEETFKNVSVHRLATRNLYDFHEAKSSNSLVRLGWHILDDIGVAPKDFASLLTKLKPDVLHTNTLSGLSTGLWKIASKLGVPVVHTLRDYYLMCTRCTLFRNEKLCKTSCRDCALTTRGRQARTRYVSGVVGNSKFTLDLHLDEGLFANAVVAEPIGSITEATVQQPQRLEPPCPSRTAPLTFGYIGRLSPTKGLDDVLEEMTASAGTERLVIAGALDTDLAKDLVARYGNDDRVTFAGFISPKEFYDQVDVIVAPSLWYEPLPRSVIDAYCFGKPVVGSIRGGTPEAMGVPPRGWVYDPAVPGDLRRALDEAITWAQGTESFDPLPPPAASVLDSYLAVYRAVIEVNASRNGADG